MNFILVEIFMCIVSLCSLILYSQKFQSNRSFIGMMFMCAIISFLIIYDSLWDVSITIFIFNFNLKLDYMTMILKLLVLIFLLNYIYLIFRFFDFEKIYIKEYIMII